MDIFRIYEHFLGSSGIMLLPHQILIVPKTFIGNPANFSAEKAKIYLETKYNLLLKSSIFVAL